MTATTQHAEAVRVAAEDREETCLTCWYGCQAWLKIGCACAHVAEEWHDPEDSCEHWKPRGRQEGDDDTTV